MNKTKVCTKCNRRKQITLFNKRYNGVQPHCSKYTRLASRKHYRANVSKYIARRLSRKKELVSWFRELKRNLKCERCSENHLGTLDCHHKEKRNKIGSLSDLITQRGFSKKRLLEELQKCIILCSNCHRKEHWEEKNLIQEDSVLVTDTTL